MKCLKHQEVLQDLVALDVNRDKMARYSMERILENIRHLINDDKIRKHRIIDPKFLIYDEQLEDVLQYCEDTYNIRFNKEFIMREYISVSEISETARYAIIANRPKNYALTYIKVNYDKNNNISTEGPYLKGEYPTEEHAEQEAMELTNSQQNSAVIVKIIQSRKKTHNEIMSKSRKLFKSTIDMLDVD